MAFCSVPRRWLVKLARRRSASGRRKQLSFRFVFEKWHAYCCAYARDANACFNRREHATGIDALLGGLKRNGFSFASVHHGRREFPKVRGRRSMCIKSLTHGSAHFPLR